MSRNTRAALGALIAVRTLEALSSSAMLPFVVLWAQRDVGLGGLGAGILFVAQAIGEVAGGVAGGGMADRYGRRRILLLSTLGMALGYGLLSVAGTPLVAAALFLTAGVFESAFHPTVAALVGDSVPDDELPQAFSLLRMGANAGRIVGPLLGALAVLHGLSSVFALSGALLLGAVLVEAAVVRPTEGESYAGDEEAAPGTLRALRNDAPLAVLVLSGGLLAITFTWWQADGLPLLQEQTSISAGSYAALLSIAAVVVVAGQLPVTRALRSVPARTALLLGAVAQGTGLLMLVAASGGYGVLVAAAALLALGEMIFAPTISTVVTRRARPAQRASYQAALSITEDVGTAVGPLSGLALARTATSAGLWAIGAALCICAGVLGRRAAEHSREQVRR